jgi:hypothetical protein
MWGSHKINRMSPNSNAAEQAAAADASHDTVWMRSLLVELGAWSAAHRAPLFCDNNGVVGIANKTVGLTHRNRWMRIDYFHFRDFQRSGDIVVRRISTKTNPADFFTKDTGTNTLRDAVLMLTGAAAVEELPPELRRCLFHDKVSTDPLPDTPITAEERKMLQSVCEAPYIMLDEEDHREDDKLAAEGQAVFSIRGEGHTQNGQGYADFAESV